MIDTPCISPNAIAAREPSNLSSAETFNIFPIKDFLEIPKRTGLANSLKLSKFFSI